MFIYSSTALYIPIQTETRSSVTVINVNLIRIVRLFRNHVHNHKILLRLSISALGNNLFIYLVDWPQAAMSERRK